MRVSVATIVLAVACGPGVTMPDGGLDAGETPDVGHGADDTGMSCEGLAQGSFVCTPLFRQCCDGQWYVATDGPCFPRDAGFADAGPPDCVVSPTAVGCPCDTEGAAMCRAFQSSIECTGGVWTDLVNIACCNH